MHRTQGDGFVLESGLRRFVDQNLPSTPGTVHPAEWDNAVQEELCYVITAAGLTVASTALADRTAGWHQLYDAIFDSEAIDTGALTDGAVTNDKVTSCGLSKLVYVHSNGGVDVSYTSGGVTYGLELSPIQSEFKYTSGSSVITNTQLSSSIDLTQKLSGVNLRNSSVTLDGWALNLWSSYPDDAETLTFTPDDGMSHTLKSGGSTQDNARLGYAGLTFTDNGVAAGETLRFRVIDLDSATWSGSGPYYTTVSTGLSAFDDAPMTATLRYRVVSGGNIYVSNPLGNTTYRTIFIINGATWDVQVMVNENIAGASYNQRKLLVWYG